MQSIWKILPQAFVLLQVLVFVHGSGCPASFDYFTAMDIHRARNKLDLDLWNMFGVWEKHPGAVDNSPSEWYGVDENELKLADILLIYKELLSNEIQLNSTCNVPKLNDFDSDFSEYKNCVKKSARCSPRRSKCDKTEKWRSYDGTCNNIRYSERGARNMPFSRLLKPKYADGINSIRPSPSPREIGNHLEQWDKEFVQKNPYESTGTPNVFALMMQQLITHDNSGFVKTQMTGDAKYGVQCCSNSFDQPLPKHLQNSHCLAMDIPPNDPFFKEHGVACQNFIRAQKTLDNCYDNSGGVKELNTVAAYLDLHPIYAQSPLEAEELRSGSGGKFALKKDILVDGYRAGDSRAPQTPWLSILHSLFYRLHNLIARKLARMYRNESDAFIFNNTRELTIALYNHLLYDDLFPQLLGTEYSQRVNLTCGKGSGSCGSYDSKLEASSIVEFSMGAFRSPHVHLPNDVNLYDRNYKLTGSMDLSDIVDKPLLEENYNPLLRGMLEDPIKTNELGCSGAVRNKFQKNECGFGMDLCAVDIMRGRDFGIAPFIDYIQLCDGATIKRWGDLKRFFSDGHLRLLRRIYANVKEIDLLVGVMLEYKRFGTYGTVGACIVGEQFRRLKFGDRFFYTFSSRPNPFTADQIKEINRLSFAQMLCWVTDLKTVPQNSLLIPGPNNPRVNCKDFPSIELKKFTDFFERP